LPLRGCSPKEGRIYSRPSVHCGIGGERGCKNRSKSRVRAKGEHPFLILKRGFGFTKVRYRGLYKNAQRLTVACALVNLFQLRRPLLRLAQV
jgi:IS5 family transposase